jgi:hypothetical protein
MEQTKKEKIYKELQNMKKGEVINMVQICKNTDSTLSHLSLILRMAKEAGFLEFHSQGNYEIRNIPDSYEEFNEAVSQKTREYRQTTASYSTGERSSSSQAHRTPRVLKLEVDEENIGKIINSIVRERKSLKDKVTELEEENTKLKTTLEKARLLLKKREKKTKPKKKIISKFFEAEEAFTR